ncbi:hypothetical protein GCM10020000_03010 [Streptomyces olivoverticillatus]
MHGESGLADAAHAAHGADGHDTAVVQCGAQLVDGVLAPGEVGRPRRQAQRRNSPGRRGGLGSGEDAPVDPLQPGARHRAPGAQRVASAGVHLQSLGLPARLVQRGHQQFLRPLPQRVIVRQGPQRADRRGVPAQVEFRFPA